ncbi:OmpA family protein [Devosia naphthalenivorans]|uniref:OmpA family protein n=1 Tax=Devosia naphthalenivorans TaxID=2082392 RepID=UPI0013B05185|nr:OmpA family protein [Devosia naphthalenivorans]
MSTGTLKNYMPRVAFSFLSVTLLLVMPGQGFAQSAIGPARTSGSITVLDLPRVADYWVSATRQPGGKIVFDGYAPDEATRTDFANDPNADVQWLQLGSGSPTHYHAALEFGLTILDQLEQGRFALRDNVVTLTGSASSQADYVAVTDARTEGLPQGLVLARAEILPPKAEAFQWTATKSSDGAIALTGMVPDAEAEQALLRASGASTGSELTYASGGPDDFVTSAQLGVELLKRLSEGKASFDGTGWTLTGTGNSPADKLAIEAEFTRRQLAAAGWSLAIAQTAAPAASEPEAPAVDPNYAFSATKDSSGEIILSGQIPADPALRFFGAITGGNTDAVSITPGAPPDFIGRAETGIRALMQLPEGNLSFSQGTWSLTGTASDEETRDTVTASLRTDAGDAWNLEIALAAIPEPAAPAPSAPVPPTAAADLAACVAPLADFSARNAILFRSGAAVITPESTPALDELAADLSACPDAIVHIEGHTDADGDDQSNLALSVARAEAVVAALVERGVVPERLYALGYGESSPISDNDTPEGKRLNRRIVVKVSAEP